MAGTKSNPDNVGVPNEYAGFVAPKRADQSTILPGGNVVDRNAIPKTMGGSGAESQAKPLGKPAARPSF